MTVNETFNIHKEINCIFPFFKSKFLCEKGLHNFRISSDMENWQCYCCGKKIKID